MKIEIKKIIIQEGLLDFIKENKGKLGLLAGAGAGIGLHNNYMNSGAKSIGEYTGTKFDQASNHLKNGYDTAKSGIMNTYNDIKKSLGKDQTSPKTGIDQDKLKHDEIMKQGTNQQTVQSALDPNKAKAFDSAVDNHFNTDNI